jgi:uncharacterized protein
MNRPGERGSRACLREGVVRPWARLRIACVALVVAATCIAVPVAAQVAGRLSITTGGPGGVYFPLGEGMARVLSKYLPGTSVTAAATHGSVENLKLIAAGKADMGFTMVDAAWQAANGTDQFKNKPVDARTLMVLYPNRMQIVTLEGTGIRSLADLKGRRVSTGAAGSGVEVMALRVLDAMGIDPVRDLKRQQLGVAEAARALKERKLDAFFWVGGVPTPAISELAANAGAKIRLLDHAEILEALNAKYGPLYVKGIIKANAYPGMDQPVANIDVWNLLVTDAKLSDQMAYDIVKTLVEKKAELVALHKEAQNIDLRYQKIGSPLPYHPGARRYFEEHGVRF